MASEILGEGEVSLTVIKAGGQRNNVILRFDPNNLPEASDVVNRIGIQPKLPIIKPILGDVVSGEPGDLAGLKEHDLIRRVNGDEIATWREWVEATRANPNTLMRVQVFREGQLIELNVMPKQVAENDVFIGRIGVMPFIDADISQGYHARYVLGGVAAISEAATQTISYSLLTVKLIGRMLIGEESVQNLSGPISLAQYAGKSASIGLVPFLKFVAFVSVSLGVMNLLPIPMLDGGHLFFYIIEAIKGKPVSNKAQGIFMRVGMLLLLCLMVLAVFIDVGRLIG